MKLEMAKRTRRMRKSLSRLNHENISTTLTITGVVRWTQAVYGFYERFGIFRWGKLADAVAEVKDVAMAVAEAGQGFFYLLGNGGRVGEQNGGVEVTLQRDTLSHLLAGSTQVGGPVQADGITASGGDVFQPLSAALGEQNHWNGVAIAFAG